MEQAPIPPAGGHVGINLQYNVDVGFVGEINVPQFLPAPFLFHVVWHVTSAE